MEIKIRKALPADAEQILEHTRICGSETDNMSYGGEGFKIKIEDEKKFLEKILNLWRRKKSEKEKRMLVGTI